jgi:hypothetical protein
MLGTENQKEKIFRYLKFCGLHNFFFLSTRVIGHAFFAGSNKLLGISRKFPENISGVLDKKIFFENFQKFSGFSKVYMNLNETFNSF